MTIRADDDDDFEIELEDTGDTSGLPPDDDEVQGVKGSQVDSFNLPEGEEEAEEGVDDPGEKPGAGNGEDDVYSARREADAAREEALRTKADSILAAAEAEHNNIQAQLVNAKLSLGSLDLHLEKAYAALAVAKDAGDTAAEIKLTRDINGMEGLKGQIEAAKAQAPTRDQIMAKAKAQIDDMVAKSRSTAQPKGADVGHNVRAVTPLAEKWAKQNPWMKTNAEANSFVVRKAAQLTKDGWDMNTPGFYLELSAQVERAYPGLKTGKMQAKPQPVAKPTNKSAVAPSRPSSSSGMPEKKPTSLKSYRLDAKDQAAMRRMNLDPHNTTHQKAFAKARIEGNRRPNQF